MRNSWNNIMVHIIRIWRWRNISVLFDQGLRYPSLIFLPVSVSFTLDNSVFTWTASHRRSNLSENCWQCYLYYGKLITDVDVEFLNAFLWSECHKKMFIQFNFIGDGSRYFRNGYKINPISMAKHHCCKWENTFFLFVYSNATKKAVKTVCFVILFCCPSDS